MCFVGSWRVDDLPAPGPSDGEGDSSGGDIEHILTQLEPYTQYAFYVKTNTIATEKTGAQSKIKYFRTFPYSKWSIINTATHPTNAYSSARLVSCNHILTGTRGEFKYGCKYVL